MRLFDEMLPGYRYLVPDGAFYLFFRVDPAFEEGRDSAAAVCSWLLEETGVAVVPGEAFGEPRYARMSFATSDALLEDAIRRMAGLLT
jgi:aspartate aminotransferase